MTEDSIGSKLPEAHERFFSKYLTRLKQSVLITPEMLYETFTPERLFDGYQSEVESRGKVLVLTGRLTAEYAGAFDRSAFNQVVTAAVKIGDIKLEKLFETVSSDELVRVHDRKELYAQCELTAWYEKDTLEHREIAAHLLTDYLKEELGGGRVNSLHDIENIFGFELYVKHLPSEVLVAIIKSARGANDGGNGNGPGGVKFSADVLAETATAEVLAKHMPLPLVQKLIASAAIKHGYKDPPKPVEVPMPPASESEAPASGSMTIPKEALDSVAPPPSDSAKADSEDPELEIGGSEGAMDLELDDMLENDSKKSDGDRPSITDDDDTNDEPTMVVDAPGVESRGKNKGKVPPPHNKR